MCVYHLLELELDKEKKQSRWTKLKGKKKSSHFLISPAHQCSVLRYITLIFLFFAPIFPIFMNQR